VRARVVASSEVAWPLAAAPTWLEPGPASQAAIALAGVRTSYMRSQRGDDRPSRTELRGALWIGRVSGLVEGAENVGAATLTIDSVDAAGARFAFDARAGMSARDDGVDGWAILATASARDLRGLGVALRGSARGVADVRALHAVMSDRELAIDARPLWLAPLGTGTRSTFGVGADWPLDRAWSMGVDLDGARDDVTTTLVRGAARLAFVDPCGCLSARVSGGHLLGRSGLDVLVSIELAPVASLSPRGAPR
jgi:hypothetical protein